MRLFFVCFCLLGLLSSLAWAQTPTTTSTVTAPAAAATQPVAPTFSGQVSAAFNSNFVRPQNYESEQSISSDLMLNYRVRGEHVLRGYVGAEKQLYQGYESKVADGYFAWLNGSFWLKESDLLVGQQVRVHAPYSRESRDRDTKYTGVSLIPSFTWLIAPTFNLTYQPNFTKNFHTYRQNRQGKLNPEYGLSHSLVATWSMTDTLYFQPTYVYRNSWSYGGTRRSPSYLIAGELGYLLQPSLTLAAGWNNEESMTRTEYGPDSDFEVFNNNSSTFYTALYWAF